MVGIPDQRVYFLFVYMVVCYNFWGKDSNLKKCLADNNVLTEEYIEKIMQLFAGNEDKE